MQSRWVFLVRGIALMRPYLWVIACVAALSSPGCGDAGRGVAVSGKVTFEGEPVQDGSIQFIPQPGTDGPSAGATIADGTYSIPAQSGPVPGTYRVQIQGYKNVRPRTAKEMGPGLMGMDPKDAPGLMKDQWVKESIIPKRYNTASDLTATVPEQGSVTLDFALTK
jgi:hypothetical protein